MSYILEHSKRGNLLLPLICIIILVHFTILLPILQDLDLDRSIARGSSAISIDLEASFRQMPGVANSSKGAGADDHAGTAGAGTVWSPREGAQAKTYLGEVLRRIEQNKFYPEQELKKGSAGIVRLSFMISNTGSLSMLKLLKSSGNKEFDKAALNTLENSGPFPKFPKEVTAESLPVVIDVEYKLSE